jgi:hypothetical protein
MHLLFLLLAFFLSWPVIFAMEMTDAIGVQLAKLWLTTFRFLLTLIFIWHKEELRGNNSVTLNHSSSISLVRTHITSG